MTLSNISGLPLNITPQIDVMCMSGLNKMMMFTVLIMTAIFIITKRMGFEKWFNEKTGEEIDISMLFAGGLIAFCVTFIFISYISVV